MTSSAASLLGGFTQQSKEAKPRESGDCKTAIQTVVGGEHVGHAALFEDAARLPDGAQKVVDVVESANLVHEHELFLGAPPQDLADGRDRVREALHLDAVAQRRDPRVLSSIKRAST